MSSSFGRATFLLVVLGLSCLISAQECDPTTGVCDTHERCAVWKAEGECAKSQTYMRRYCPGSCADHVPSEDWEDEESDDFDDNIDNDVSCIDTDKRCEVWEQNNECVKNPVWMHKHCAKSCNTCDTLAASDVGDNRRTSDAVESDTSKSVVEQSAAFGEVQEAKGPEKDYVVQRLEETIRYMESVPTDLLDTCKNKEQLCSFWSVKGECEKNKDWMDKNCGPACRSCDTRDYNTRCQLPGMALQALAPNSLDRMFKKIVARAPGNRTDVTPKEMKALEQFATPMYTVHVHSSPEQSERPWVITLDNFLTHSECEAMVLAGYNKGYHKPTQGFNTVPEHAWCTDEERGCRTQLVPQRLHERISQVLGLPPKHMENFQLLKYEKDQFYSMRHDYVAADKDLVCGPRILSVVMYLNDVEEGGEISFPSLDLRIPPKQGRIVLWPNVLSSDPTVKDARTMHQTYPVISGTKFTTNSWVHLYDWVTPLRQNCLK